MKWFYLFLISAPVFADPTWIPGSIVIKCNEEAYTPIELMDFSNFFNPTPLPFRANYPQDRLSFFKDMQGQLAEFSSKLKEVEAKFEIMPGDYNLDDESLPSANGCSSKLVTRVLYDESLVMPPKIFFNKTLLNEINPLYHDFIYARTLATRLSADKEATSNIFQGLFIGKPIGNDKNYYCRNANQSDALPCQWLETLKAVGISKAEYLGIPFHQGYDWNQNKDRYYYGAKENNTLGTLLGITMLFDRGANVLCPSDNYYTAVQANDTLGRLVSDCTFILKGKSLYPNRVHQNFFGFFDLWTEPAVAFKLQREANGAGELSSDQELQINLIKPSLGSKIWKTKKVTWDENKNLRFLSAPLDHEFALIEENKTIKVSPSQGESAFYFNYELFPKGNDQGKTLLFTYPTGILDLKTELFELLGIHAVTVTKDRESAWWIEAQGNEKSANDLSNIFKGQFIESKCRTVKKFHLVLTSFDHWKYFHVTCEDSLTSIQFPFLSQYNGEWSYVKTQYNGNTSFTQEIELKDGLLITLPIQFGQTGLLEPEEIQTTVFNMNGSGWLSGKCSHEMRIIKLFSTPLEAKCEQWSMDSNDKRSVSFNLNDKKEFVNLKIPNYEKVLFDVYFANITVDKNALKSSVHFYAATTKKEKFVDKNGKKVVLRANDYRHFYYNLEHGLRIE